MGYSGSCKHTQILTGQTHKHSHAHARTHMLVSRAFQRCLDCCCHWSNGSHMSVAPSLSSPQDNAAYS